MKSLADNNTVPISSTPSSNEDKVKMHIGVGIGIGLGIPLLITLALLILEWRKRLALENHIATAQGVAKTGYGQNLGYNTSGGEPMYKISGHEPLVELGNSEPSELPIVSRA
jgi:hypothetical protein